MLIRCGGLLCGSKQSMISFNAIALFTIINPYLPTGINLRLSSFLMFFLFSQIILSMLD